MKILKNPFGKKPETDAPKKLVYPDDFYQAIANEVTQCISEPWLRVNVEAKRHESSINLKVIYTRPDGTRNSSVDFIYLPKYFFDLAESISTKERGLYKACNFTLENTGAFNVDFQY